MEIGVGAEGPNSRREALEVGHCHGLVRERQHLVRQPGSTQLGDLVLGQWLGQVQPLYQSTTGRGLDGDAQSHSVSPAIAPGLGRTASLGADRLRANERYPDLLAGFKPAPSAPRCAPDHNARHLHFNQRPPR